MSIISNKDVNELIFKCLSSLLKTFKLPSHETIVETFKWSVAVFILALVSTLFDFPTFIDWQGALICVIVILAFMFAERHERNYLQSMYDEAKKYADVIKHK